jgi:hypothetical protein
MADTNTLKRGDEVIVKFATHDNYIEHLATVVGRSAEKLFVEFACGFKYSVPHGENRYRRNPHAG